MKTTLSAVAIVALLIPTMLLGDSTSEVMKKKTQYAEHILRYLALGDLAKVHVEAGQLEKLTVKAGLHSKGEAYGKYGEDFLKTVRALRKTSGEGNLAGSYFEFSRMTGMCFSCHEHVREGNE